MRTHGWAGSPPTSDEEAVDRILDAARAGLDRIGRDLRITDVARDLGVTRQTVYRYFPSTEDLVTATALRAAGPFLERLERQLAGVTDPGEAVVRGLLLTTLELPGNPYLSIALFPDGPATHVSQVTSPVAVQLGLGLVESLEVDWAAAGLDDARLAELVEHMLRLLQSFLVEPADRRRSPAELEAYLDRWLRPAVDRLTTRSPGTR